MSEHNFLRPPDYEQRQKALDIHGSFIVQAPAGSGKTGLLMQRFLKLLAESEIEMPEQVLAITFTRKAAAEMLHHIVDALENSASGTEPEGDSEFDHVTHALATSVLQRSTERGWDLLRQPQRLRIDTIDALCMDIVKRLPLLAGGGDLDPIEDPEPLYEEAAQRTLRELGSGNAALDDALRTVVLYRNGRLNECAELIAEMLKSRDQWLRHVPKSEEALHNWRSEFEQLMRRILARPLAQLLQGFPSHLLKELSEITHIATKNLQMDDKQVKHPVLLDDADPPTANIGSMPKWRGLAELLTTRNGDWRKRLDKSVGLKSGTEEQKRATALLNELQQLDDGQLLENLALLNSDALPPMAYDDNQWQLMRAIFQVLPRACANLNVLFAERSQCDFAALSIAAVYALKQESGSHELSLALGTRIQHLLVDEVQDTSYTHYELLQALTTSWDGASQTVFLVGDPKQSIYLFREARVELFLQALENGLGEVPLEPVQLTANFRSHAVLVDAFNEDFEKIFETADIATHADAKKTGGSRNWHLRTFYKINNKTKEDHAAIQAQEIAATIDTVLSDATKTMDRIAILVRNRNHAKPITEALRQYGITYTATEIESLSDQPEVQDLTALTRALLHPADRIAWLAVLRAPWCGLTLESLLKLTGDDKDTPMAQLIEQNAPLLNAAEHERLLHAWHTLRAASNLYEHAPLPEVVERAWISLGGTGMATAYQREDKSPADVLRNVESYFDLLDKLSAEHPALDAALIESRLEAFKTSSSPVGSRVEVLTIHKAKGLEWDHVFVPALHKIANKDKPHLLEWYEAASILGEVNPNQVPLFAPAMPRGTSHSKEPAFSKWIRNFKRHRQYGELKRLFYVACTRARRQLHLYAVVEDNRNFLPTIGTLLRAAWPAAQQAHSGERIHVEPLAIAPAETLAMAAAAEPEMTLRRVQAGANPIASYTAALGTGYYDASPGRSRQITPGGVARPQRPESSLAARALGNVVHRWMQLLAEKFAAGAAADEALALVKNSGAVITAQLRHEGAPAGELHRLCERAMHALTNTLQDPNGLWLLSMHNEASTEYSLSLLRDGRAMQLRLDRILRAGQTPMSNEGDSLWIADYKTSEPSKVSVKEFLAEEREIYRRQLEGYAEALRLRDGSEQPVRLALYYPLLPALDWWEF